MPNSLKCRLKGLVRKGLLSEKDLARIYTDNDVTKILEKIKAEIEEKEFKLNCATMSDVALKTAYIEVAKLLDNHISELKEK